MNNHPKRTPAYTFGARKIKSTKSVPSGPGYYNPEKPYKNISAGYEKAKRIANRKEIYLGPPRPASEVPTGTRKW